jgi:hypothetical protein
MAIIITAPDLTALARTAISLGVAFLLGTLIGFERQWRKTLGRVPHHHPGRDRSGCVR